MKNNPHNSASFTEKKNIYVLPNLANSILLMHEVNQNINKYDCIVFPNSSVRQPMIE